jgi:cell fate (sporulation/competence/biofilm development) regulator YlbF (YheA/YmcA/DUF963 family)
VSENGGSHESTIILSLTKEPWQLNITGECENLNVALAMLEEAKRVFEMKWKVGAAVAETEAAKQNVAEFQRVQSLLGRNQRKQ